MAITVPQYDSPQVQARSAGNSLMNTGSVSADAMGASIARGMQAAGAGVEDFGNEMTRIKQRQDTNDVMAVESQLNQWENDNLNNPESGFFTKQGINAQGGTNKLAADYDKYADTLRNGLKNADQQRAFDAIYSKRRNAMSDAASRHELVETRKATTAQADALVTGAINGAAANYTDPESIRFHMVNGARAILTNGVAQGLPEDVVNTQIEDFTSKSHAAVIARMMEDSPTAAQKYYDANKDEIAGTTQLTLQRTLKQTVDKDEARRASETIYASGASLADMLAEARKIENTDVSDATVARIKTMYQETETAKTQTEEKIWQNLVENPSYDAIPAELDGSTQIRMREYVTERMNKGLITTDGQLYQDLLTMAANNPEDFLATSLPQFATGLDKSAMDYLKSLQSDIRSNGSVATAGIRSQQEMVKSQMDVMGLGKKAQPEYFKRAQEEAVQFQKDNNRQMNPEEFQKMLDRISINMTNKGWYNPTSDSFMYQKTVDGVPTVYVDELSEQLKKNGRPVTDAELKRAYSLAVQNGFLKPDQNNPVGPKNDSKGAPASGRTSTFQPLDYDRTAIPQTSSVNDSLTNAIYSAASKTGEDPDLMIRIAKAESSYGKYNTNANSSAAGPFQILGGTFADIQNRLGAQVSDPHDPDDAALAAATYLKDLRKQIEPVAGKNPSDGDMYLAWFAGAGGARNIIGAIKNGQGGEKATDYLTRNQVAANRSLLFDRLGRPITVSQFYQLMSNKVA